jgi:hypothetical protein
MILLFGLNHLGFLPPGGSGTEISADKSCACFILSRRLQSNSAAFVEIAEAGPLRILGHVSSRYLPARPGTGPFASSSVIRWQRMRYQRQAPPRNGMP